MHLIIRIFDYTLLSSKAQNLFSEYETSRRLTFTDFVASLGGIFGLYLGFSIVSFVEIVYWFTFRFVVNTRH